MGRPTPELRPSSRAARRVLRFRMTGWRWALAVAAWILGGVLGGLFVLLGVLLARSRPDAEELTTIWILAAAFPAAGAFGGWLLARWCRDTEVDPVRRVVQRANGGAVPFERVVAVALYETSLEMMGPETPLFHVALVTDLAGERFVALCRGAEDLEPGGRRPAPDAVEAAAALDEDGVVTICANASAGYAERAAAETARRIGTVVLVIRARAQPCFVRVRTDGGSRDGGPPRYGLLDP